MMKNYTLIGLFILCFTGLFTINFWQNESAFSLKKDQHLLARNIKVHYKKKKDRIKNQSPKNEKYDGPENYVQYFNDIATKTNELEPSYEPNYKMLELKKAKSRLEKVKRNRSGRGSNDMVTAWKERGPANVPGRTRGLIVDPDDNEKKTWYAGSVGGGVWKTEDAGASWRLLTKDLPNLGTTVLAMAKSNSNIIYMGTGEGYGSRMVRGDGIFKSLDKGESWLQLNNTIEFTEINRLVIDPSDENIVVVVSNNGIYRTEDGGNSWTKVYASNSKIQDLKADPKDFNILYASINSIGILKSIDKGLTWENTSAGLSNFSRLEIAVANNNTSIVYLSAETGTGSVLFVSLNAGENWTPYNDIDGTNPDWLQSQGWFDNTIVVHPFNDNIVYTGGIDLWKLSLNLDSSGNPDGTISALHLTDAYGETDMKNINVHPDHHNLVIIEGENSEFRILNANDGGIFYSKYSTDPGVLNGDWSDPVLGYNSTQFYGADKKHGADEYIAGAQDNGTWHSQAGETASETSEYNFDLSGDGFEVAWNYFDPDKMIGASQFNGLRRTLDGGLSWNSATSGITDDGPFISRIASSQIDPDLLFVVGSSGVWKSADFGKNWTSKPITSKWGFSNTVDVEISLASPQVVWAGSGMDASRKIHVSRDGGETFNPTNNFEDLGMSSGIYSHPTDPGSAFVLFSQAASPKILKTSDYGESWVDISGFEGNNISDRGFPDAKVYSILVMPHNTDVIWVGTEIGIFESEDSGQNWVYLDSQNEFPAVSVWDMKVVDDQVVIATHGRGVWTATIPELPAPPTITLPAQFADVWQPLKEGYHIAASILLRSEYDKSEVYIDGEKVKDIEGNSEVKALSFNASLSTGGSHQLQVISYVGEDSYFSSIMDFNTFKILPSLKSYKTDFNFSENYFSGNGFSIKNETGFGSKAIHSLHPYTNNRDFTYTLTFPIIVDASDGIFTYKDVAIIEKGNDGVNFGDIGFWDYVIVEASTDNHNWVALEDGYDANANSTWSETHDANGNGNSTMFVNHQISLTDKFEDGDVILIRFRLYADEFSSTWGWAIDDLQIQPSFNNKPIAVDDVFTATLKGNVLINDSDLDGDDLIVSETLVSEPENGTVVLAANGDFTYKPNAHFTEGTDSFEYRVFDNVPNSLDAIASVTLNVTPLLGFENDSKIKQLSILSYPNPAKEFTRIKYYLPKASGVNINVFDSRGKLIKKYISSSILKSGYQEYILNLKEFEKGLYIIRLITDYGLKTTKLLVK